MTETEFEFDLGLRVAGRHGRGGYSRCPLRGWVRRCGRRSRHVWPCRIGGLRASGQDPEAVIAETVKQVMMGLPDGDEASGGEARPRQLGGRRRAAQGDAASPAKKAYASPLIGRVVQSIGDAPIPGRRPGEAERRFPRRSGMVCRRSRRTTGKRQDQSCGARRPGKIRLVLHAIRDRQRQSLHS